MSDATGKRPKCRYPKCIFYDNLCEHNCSGITDQGDPYFAICPVDQARDDSKFVEVFNKAKHALSDAPDSWRAIAHREGERVKELEAEVRRYKAIVKPCDTHGIEAIEDLDVRISCCPICLLASEDKRKALEAEIEALRNELRRLQSVVCEEDYDIIAALLKEAGE